MYLSNVIVIDAFVQWETESHAKNMSLDNSVNL